MNTDEDTRDQILIVDDSPENIVILSELLYKYRCAFALNGADAIAKTHGNEHFDLILLDIMMPEMNGYEVCRELKKHPKTRSIPIIFISCLNTSHNEAEGLELGAADYISKPFNPAVVKVRVKCQLELRRVQTALRDQNELLEEIVQERTAELERTRAATILSLASLAETRDNETGNHIRRTQAYVNALALHLNDRVPPEQRLNRSTVNLLTQSASLHDIGKVGVRDSILLKTGPLNQLEFEKMKEHCLYGHQALLAAERELETSSFLRYAREIAYSHHERWDGSGYPQGLRGEAIPLGARLMAIADVYDALISRRVYKEPMPHSQAVQIITQGDGRTSPKHFDPVLLNIFSEIHGEFTSIAQRYNDEEHSDYGVATA